MCKSELIVHIYLQVNNGVLNGKALEIIIRSSKSQQKRFLDLHIKNTKIGPGQIGCAFWIALNETDSNINSENRNSTSQVSDSTNQQSPSNSVDLRNSVSDFENPSRPGSRNSSNSRNSAKNKNITQRGDLDSQQ